MPLGLDSFNVIERVMRERADAVQYHRISPNNTAVQNGRVEVEILVEAIFSEIDQRYIEARKRDDERLLKLIVEGAVDDCSEEMLERASTLLAQAAIIRRKKADEERLTKVDAPPAPSVEEVFATKTPYGHPQGVGISFGTGAIGGQTVVTSASYGTSRNF